MLEIAISTSIVSAVLLATASAFSSTMNATEQARRTTEAAIFLEATMENLSAQEYENLLSLNGNVVFDGTNAGDSEYSVGLNIFLADVNLIQVTATLTDLEDGRNLGRLSALRTNR